MADIEIENYTASLWRLDSDAQYKEDHGIGLTAWIDGKPCLSSGIIIIWPGMGHAWMIIHNQKLFLSNIKKILAGFKVIFGAWAKRFRRVQADVQCGFSGGINWAEHLGFDFEYVAKKYGPNGEDFGKYARISE